jgi:hypothetical protein
VMRWQAPEPACLTSCGREHCAMHKPSPDVPALQSAIVPGTYEILCGAVSGPTGVTGSTKKTANKPRAYPFTCLTAENADLMTSRTASAAIRKRA